MSDFLGRLAARALGTEVPLQARVPSRFEPEGAVVVEESPFSDPRSRGGEAGAARPGDLTPYPPLPSHTPPPGEGAPPPSLQATESVLPVSSPGEPPSAPPSVFQPSEGASARSSPGREPRGRGPLSLPEPSESSPGAHAPGYALTPPPGARSGGEARGFRVEGGLPERREKVDASPSEDGGSPSPGGRGVRWKRGPGGEGPGGREAGDPPGGSPPGVSTPGYHGSPRPGLDSNALPAPAPIRVTIGRIEVRAAAPAPPAAPPRPAAGPRLTLDDYLRRRNEGRL